MATIREIRVCRTLLSQYDPNVLDIYKAEMAHGIEKFFLLSYCLACCWPGLGATSNLRIMREWAQLDFRFPSEEDRQIALSDPDYIPHTVFPIDVDVQYRSGDKKSRIFVTIPRIAKGRPVTLGVVDDDGLISPYPDYSWQRNLSDRCQGLTSVFRVAIDMCNRLWVMDTGKIGDEELCPPQLLAFDLNTDQLIYRHIVKTSLYNVLSLFITPIVDIRGDCADTFVYVADVSGFGLLVVDVANDRSWRIAHRYFYPYPNRGTFTVDGESFDLMDGVFGLALTPYVPGRERYLYFHALASTTENIVRTSYIRNDSFISDPNADPKSIYSLPGERPNQAASEAMDKNGILYYGIMDPPSIWCWNSATEFSPRNFHKIAVNRETLQFASGLKIVTNLKGEEELWVLTSSFQRVMTGTLNSNRINFRIHAEKLQDLLRKSLCAMPQKGNFIKFETDNRMQV